jgi:hypothetical protein
MGAAIPLSVAKRRTQGATDRSLLLHAVRRTIIMFCLGTITQGNLLLFDLSQFRPCYSVLHGLAAGYLIAGVLTPQGNVATFVDQWVLGRFHYGENTWDTRNGPLVLR